MHSSRMRTARGSSRLLGGGGCLPQCMLGYPWVWAWRPPGCGPADPPGVGLKTPRCGPGDPPGCGPGDPPGQTLNFPLGVGLETPRARPLNFPHGCGPRDLQGMLGYHPPVDRMTDTCKNITFANFL